MGSEFGVSESQMRMRTLRYSVQMIKSAFAHRLDSSIGLVLDARSLLPLFYTPPTQLSLYHCAPISQLFVLYRASAPISRVLCTILHSIILCFHYYLYLQQFVVVQRSIVPSYRSVSASDVRPLLVSSYSQVCSVGEGVKRYVLHMYCSIHAGYVYQRVHEWGQREKVSIVGWDTSQTKLLVLVLEHRVRKISTWGTWVLVMRATMFVQSLLWKVRQFTLWAWRYKGPNAQILFSSYTDVTATFIGCKCSQKVS